MTPADALKHPTWKMGNRITIDSATLMNKGFEVIEACWLFDFAPDDVEVVVHPQSTVHAMVEYNDGSVIAQVSRDRHADADPVRADLAGTRAGAGAEHRLERSAASGSSTRPISTNFRCWVWLMKRNATADRPPAS